MMRHRIERSCGPARTRRILDEAFAAYAERYARYRPHLKWYDDSRAAFGFRVRGLKVTGTLSLLADAIDLEVQVPWMLRPLHDLARRTIDAEAERLFAAPGDGGLSPQASGPM